MLKCQPPVPTNASNVFSDLGWDHCIFFSQRHSKLLLAEKETQYLNGTGHFENYFLNPEAVQKDLIDLREKVNE